jgi:hypothetical protein
MPDTATKPEGDDPSKSSTRIKAAIPHSQDKATQLNVQTDTHEHRAILEEVPAAPDDPLPDRRRQQPGFTTIVNPSPQAGGLTGLWGVAYQATGITIIFGAFMWMMYTGRTDRREEDARSRETRAAERAQDREDRSAERSQSQAAFAALTSSITMMSSRNDSRDARIDAMLEESRQSRNEMKLNQQEMLAVLKAILAKYSKPPNEPPEEATAAPMPREKMPSG